MGRFLKEQLDKAERIFNKTDEFTQVSAQDFYNALKRAKESMPQRRTWRVTLHSSEYYENAKCFITKNGSTIAITQDNEIVSLCKTAIDYQNISVKEMINFAIEQSGNHFNCFEHLDDLYMMSAFEIEKIENWDDAKAPVDWEPEYGKERVIFFSTQNPGLPGYGGANGRSVREILDEAAEKKIIFQQRKPLDNERNRQDDGFVL